MLADIHDGLSSILGWVSVASDFLSTRIIVSSPQIYENYSLQSGEGLSIVFLIIWLLGDLCNLVGAIAGSLLPTVIILAVYFSVCDMIMLAQIYYYRWKRTRKLSESSEREPLLNQPPSDPLGNSVLLMRYTGALAFVTVVGILAWWFDSGVEDSQTPPPQKELRWKVQALGWTSAVLYLGARLPQISKNFKTRCKGPSPALFFFAIFGNITYTLSICAKSIDSKYLITNAGWLAGSTLTISLDVFVLRQIFHCRAADRSTAVPQ